MDIKELKIDFAEVLGKIGGSPPRDPVKLQEWLTLAFSEGILAKAQLKHGSYYFGRCRNASVAKWDKKTQLFTYIRTKFGSSFPETINHPEDDNGFDLFIPYREIDESQIEAFKNS